MAAPGGYSPPAWIEQTKQVMKTGIVFPTEENWLKKRKKKKRGLFFPSLKKDQEKAKKIIELTGIDKIKPRFDLSE